MPLSSMTGFARGAGEGAGFRWNWEIKSVNNKGLEVRCKLPAFLDGFDLQIKKIVTAALARGSVFINVSVTRDGDEAVFEINEERLKALIEVAAKYGGHGGIAQASIDGLLSIKGVADIAVREMGDEERDSLEAALEASLGALLADLKRARDGEGARMADVLKSQLDAIEELSNAARDAAGDRVQAMQSRFLSQLTRLQNADKPVSDERLAQEVAIIAVKADVQEELDRLDSHVAEARKLLASDKPVGRRLDFLCQEFNREANTLCSKSGDSALTKIGLDLKALIDQFREQVQNIE
ncbi:YicC/YloC family endoribonuclease [Kordiimonas aestuarii]|uniref:YicC/YloC family endoribonuclease n=1 Tax=Kordiimonas aestuarii TaxID=1005925 RepID=UPI0021D20DFB|nr:YicC/YloC family endoribonuclease [Kordiimonas aestuarii]